MPPAPSSLQDAIAAQPAELVAGARRREERILGEGATGVVPSAESETVPSLRKSIVGSPPGVRADSPGGDTLEMRFSFTGPVPFTEAEDSPMPVLSSRAAAPIAAAGASSLDDRAILHSIAISRSGAHGTRAD